METMATIAPTESTSNASPMTENQASELDRIVDVFALTGSSAPAARPVPVKAAPKAKAAAAVYLTQGNAALKDDWSEF